MHATTWPARSHCKQEAVILASSLGDETLVDAWPKAHANAGAKPYVDTALAIAPSISAPFDISPDHRQRRLWTRARFASLFVQPLDLHP